MAVFTYSLKCSQFPSSPVVGYLPNGVHAVEAMLAAASIGAIWSSTSVDFGVNVRTAVHFHALTLIIYKCLNLSYRFAVFSHSVIHTPNLNLATNTF